MKAVAGGVRCRGKRRDMTYATLFPLTGARWAGQRREKEEKGDNFCTSVYSHFSRSHHIPCEQLSKYPKIILLHKKASINDTIKKCVQICRRFLNNLDPLLPLWTCFGFCSESSFASCTLNSLLFKMTENSTVKKLTRLVNTTRKTILLQQHRHHLGSKVTSQCYHQIKLFGHAMSAGIVQIKIKQFLAKHIFVSTGINSVSFEGMIYCLLAASLWSWL